MLRYYQVRCLLPILLLIGCLAVPQSYAQAPSRERLHRGTVSIITGQHGYLSARLASDLAAVLDEGDNLRVLAVAGRGALSDIVDVLHLRGIDLAVVPADVIDYVNRKNLFPTIKTKLRYVARLYNKVAHLVASDKVRSIRDLNGKKINVVSRYHGAFVTAQRIFKAAGVNYTPVFIDQRLALTKVKQGSIAATLIMSGRPSPLLAELRDDSALRIVAIPFNPALPEVYFPVQLTSADYPDLILPGRKIASIGTSSTMLVYNFDDKSPRRAKITRFVDAFLSRIGDLQKPPRHPRWRDVKLGVAVAGLQRYRSVSQWLRSNEPPAVAALRRPKKGKRSIEQLFRAFIASESASGGAEQLLRLKKSELFARFKVWRKRQRQNPPTIKTAAKGKPSLRTLFRQFIDEEVGRVGKDQVLSLSKSQLYQRFLDWRRKSSQP